MKETDAEEAVEVGGEDTIRRGGVAMIDDLS